MSDRETEYVIQLQTDLAAKFEELGFGTRPWVGELVHHLAEIAAKSRTFEREILPLLLSLDTSHNEAIKNILLAIQAHLDSLQDSITDVQPALHSLSERYDR